MSWVFEITDRNNVTFEIEEPQGFDKMSLAVNRDPEGHGIFFDFSNDALIYSGLAFELLKEEYETYGPQGVMTQTISEVCNGVKTALHVGKFSFLQYGRIAGSDCAVSCPVETTGDIMAFRNRIDQKVNLETTTSFDGATSLPAYDGLDLSVTLPSKGIYVEDHATNTPASVTAWMGTHSGSVTGTVDFERVAFFVPGYSIDVGAEIGGFMYPSDASETYDVTGNDPAPAGWIPLPYFSGTAPEYATHFPADIIASHPIVNYDAGLGRYHGPINLILEGDLKIAVAGQSTGASNHTNGVHSLSAFLGIVRGVDDASLSASWEWLSVDDGDWNPVPYDTVAAQSQTLAKSFSFNVTLNQGDRIYLFWHLVYAKFHAHANDIAFNITYNTFTGPSYFRLHGLSTTPDSPCKVFLVNEALSRITEAITDDKLRVYSEYFGRTDSEPYTAPGDGCGSLESITKGQFIRQLQNARPTQLPMLTLSYKDMMEGLKPIHNIGYGIEDDPNRAGYRLLRIEPWDYFYSDTVIMTCANIDRVGQNAKEDEVYGLFKFGFDKWEAEEYNGIDEWMTKREYRTELSEVNNPYEAISQFILSPFATEVTRRIGSDTSQDWRYDEETFLICLVRDGSDYDVEIGNIDNPANIIDPDTVINFRHRPSVIALRHLPMVLASYRVATTGSKIIFTSGEGNVYAEGEALGNCITEGEVLAENQTLTPAQMATPAEGLPVWYPERIEYRYPMTTAEFRAILANPRGLIEYSTTGMSGEGWIDKLVFHPQEGMADFTLLPKRES